MSLCPSAVTAKRNKMILISESIYIVVCLLANESAGVFSWLFISLGLSKLLNAVDMLCSMRKCVRSFAFACP